MSGAKGSLENFLRVFLGIVLFLDIPQMTLHRGMSHSSMAGVFICLGKEI
jgi:hypothetical protein